MGDWGWNQLVIESYSNLLLPSNYELIFKLNKNFIHMHIILSKSIGRFSHGSNHLPNFLSFSSIIMISLVGFFIDFNTFSSYYVLEFSKEYSYFKLLNTFWFYLLVPKILFDNSRHKSWFVFYINYFINSILCWVSS